MKTTCSVIVTDKKARTYSYEEYMNLMDHFTKLEITSGSDQGSDKIAATKLNLVRMKRWNKTLKLNERIESTIKNLINFQCWTVITEAWCGDGGQIIPAIAKIADSSNGKINLQFVFRDENPDLMNQYLTNGGKAIPKLIARNEYGADLFTWGPRPQGAVDIMTEWKNNPAGRTKDEIMLVLHKWYADNNQQNLFEEFNRLLMYADGR